MSRCRRTVEKGIDSSRFCPKKYSAFQFRGYIHDKILLLQMLFFAYIPYYRGRTSIVKRLWLGLKLTLLVLPNTLEFMDSRIPKELHRKLFELTLALYRVTDFFPQGEALRKHLREKANEIFGLASEYGFSPDSEREAVTIFAKVESIKGYIGIARSLRFVKPINLTVLEREYDALAGFFGRELATLKEEVEAAIPSFEKREELSTWEDFAKRLPRKKQGKNEDVSDMSDKQREIARTANNSNNPVEILDLNGISDRQKKILGYIQKTSQAKISDFYAFFTDISSKTIQRDLQDLVAKNFLKKEGEKRWTVYSLMTSN